MWTKQNPHHWALLITTRKTVENLIPKCIRKKFHTLCIFYPGLCQEQSVIETVGKIIMFTRDVFPKYCKLFFLFYKSPFWKK